MEEKKYKKKIRQFRRRLSTEAALRAGSIGLALGLSGATAVLLYARIFLNKLWLAEAVVTAVLIFVLITILCFCVIKPKRKEVLARIDGLGLKERLITMEELKGEESVIALKQRRDAKEHLEMLKVGSLKRKFHPVPVICSIVLSVVIVLLAVLPLPEQPVDEVAEKNMQETVLVDELITVLEEVVARANITESHKNGLKEVIEALAVSFTPEDSTLTRTAKIATASRRLDLYEAEEQNKVNILKQQTDTSAGVQSEVKKARTEQIRLSQTVQDMKNLMGTLMDVLNMVEGAVWSPEVPDGSTYSEEEEFLAEEEQEQEESEEPPEGEEPQEGEEPPEGMEQGEDGENQEGAQGNAFGNELIYDPEQGEISYGIVYEEYYQAILKALTEQEYSEDIRKMIEDYANSLE